MSDTELKPCPFCGGKARLIKNVCEENHYTGYKVFHSGFKCSLNGIETPLKDTVEDAAKAWNKRANNE